MTLPLRSAVRRSMTVTSTGRRTSVARTGASEGMTRRSASLAPTAIGHQPDSSKPGADQPGVASRASAFSPS